MLVLINKYKKIGLFIFLGVLMATLGFSKVAQADYSTSDVQSIIGETPFYYGQSSCQSSGGGDTTSGSSQNIEIAYQFLVANGYSPTGAAAIVGTMNSSEDSGLDPTKEEDDGSGDGGYGIAQWTPPTAMIAWVTAKGEDPNSLQGQLDYLLYDLQTNYPTVVAALKPATDVQSAVTMYVDVFENPADKSAEISQSIPDANSILSEYGGNTATTPSSSCSSSGTSTDCSSATGDPKILCEALPFQGDYYEYGGGHAALDSGGLAAFQAICPDPSNPPDNQSTGGPINGDPDGVSGNPSPCGVDCSALVSIAVDEAFNQNFNWVVNDYQMQGDGEQYWQSIPLNQVQPGDIVTLSDHVEIVDSYDSSTGILITFGAHETGTTDGLVTSTLSSWFDAYQYTGPGSS